MSEIQIGGKVLVLGASGFLGHQLAVSGLSAEALTLAGRSPANFDGYSQLPSYSEEVLCPLFAKADCVIHLAAITRDRRRDLLHEANTVLAKDVATWLKRENPAARLLFMSSDLAAYECSPYGQSKKQAEDLLMSMHADIVCLRAPAIAGYRLDSFPSSLNRLRSMVQNGRFVPLPNAGRFTLRLLWVEDLVKVLSGLANRKGNASDNSVWSAIGNMLPYSELVDLLAEKNNAKVHTIGVPLLLPILAGKLIAQINPASTIPLDFLEAVRAGEKEQPPSIFDHLGLPTSPIEHYIERV